MTLIRKRQEIDCAFFDVICEKCGWNTILIIDKKNKNIGYCFICFKKYNIAEDGTIKC